MRKTRRSSSVPLSVKLPLRKIREKFLIIYELEGCQKAVNLLTKHYGVRKMRIVLNGKKVERNCLAFYLKNTACFNKNGLKKRVVLHELYNHLIEIKNFEIPSRKEEKEANIYARCFLENRLYKEKQDMVWL